MTELLTLLSLFLLSPSQARAEPAPLGGAVGTVASLTGAALVRGGLQTAADTAPAHQAAVNDTLGNGDVISTGNDSSIKIIFNDNSILDLGPSTMFKIDRFTGNNANNRVALFTLLYGRLRALVTKATSPQSRMQVRTPDAVMGVRGTEFVVAAPAGFQRGPVGTASQTSVRTETTVLSGSVGVSLPRSNGQEILVPPGARIVAQPGQTQLPPPVPLSPAQLTSISSATRLADNTFDRTVSVDSESRNTNAPAAATSRHAAVAQVDDARSSVANTEAPPPSKGVGVFGALDALTDAPVDLLPGNFQTVTVTLSH